MSNISEKAKEALKKLCGTGMSPDEARELVELRYGEKISKSSAYSLAPVGATTGNRLSEEQKVKVKECIEQGMKSPEINRMLKARWGITVAKSTISYIRSEMKRGEKKEKKEEKKMEEGLHTYRGRIPDKAKDTIIRMRKDDPLISREEIIQSVNREHGITLSDNQVLGVLMKGEKKSNATDKKKRRKTTSERKSRKEIKAAGNETLTVEDLIDECRNRLNKIEDSYKTRLMKVRDQLKTLDENLVTEQ